MNAQTASAAQQHPASANAEAVLATSPVLIGIDPGAPEGDCSATVTVHVTHNTVTFTALLNMGGMHSKSATWTRRRNVRPGWACNGPADFIGFEEEISRELGEYVDGLDFPYAVANMLPGKRASAEVVAEAAKAVQA